MDAGTYLKVYSPSFQNFWFLFEEASFQRWKFEILVEMVMLFWLLYKIKWFCVLQNFSNRWLMYKLNYGYHNKVCFEHFSPAKLYMGC